jgi:hypoxanthine-guanine phosphoribosyltransferase
MNNLLLISSEQITRSVNKIANEINSIGENTVIILVKENSLNFLIHILKLLTIKEYYVKYYHNLVINDFYVDKNVIIIDTLVNKGNKMEEIRNDISKYTKSIKTCCLLNKTIKGKNFTPDIIGYKVPNLDYKGFGLDYKITQDGIDCLEKENKNHPDNIIFKNPEYYKKVLIVIEKQSNL